MRGDRRVVSKEKRDEVLLKTLKCKMLSLGASDEESDRKSDTKGVRRIYTTLVGVARPRSMK